jgi:hypothetical protein
VPLGAERRLTESQEQIVSLWARWAADTFPLAPPQLAAGRRDGGMRPASGALTAPSVGRGVQDLRAKR